MKVMRLNYGELNKKDAPTYVEDDYTLEQIVEEISNIMESGQGPSSWGVGALIDGWKGRQITNLVSLLSPEEKKEIWKELNSPEAPHDDCDA